MSNKSVYQLFTAALTAVMLLTAFPGYACASSDTADTVTQAVTSSPDEVEMKVSSINASGNFGVSWPQLRRDYGQHYGYVAGYDDGTFRPNITITRAQAASLLYRLIVQPGQEFTTFEDVSETAYYYKDVGYLAAIGVIDFEGSLLKPDEDLTRAEFTSMIVRLASGNNYHYYTTMPFVDVAADNKYFDEISYAAYRGWVFGIGEDKFNPELPVTRGEAVATINRVLGAVPDREYLKGSFFSPFSDVFATHWAYYDILEATIPHTHVSSGATSWIDGDVSAFRREPGPFYVGLDLYYMGDDGTPLTNQSVGHLYFGADGRYTSGDATIDSYVHSVLATIITPGMTPAESLRAAYLYTRDSFSYLTRNYYSPNATGWDIKEATTMFTTGRGNCYCYAAVFQFLARQLGYDAVAVAGMCSPNNPHGWVEIEIDGVNYMFDTELEMAHRKQGRNTNLYMIPMTQLPWRYWR